MTRDESSFNRKDFDTLIDFCRELEVKEVNFDRFKNNKLVTETIELTPKSSRDQLVPLMKIV